MGCSCYDLIKNKFKDTPDFNAMVQFGQKTKFSKMFSDADSIAGYIESLGIKSGDVVTVFLPTVPNVFVCFYALNKMGVIANIVHPLTSPDNLEEILISTNSKAIFVLDILVKDYVELFNRRFEKVIICSNSDYTRNVIKAGVKIYEKKVCSGIDKINNRITYSEALKIGQGKSSDYNFDGTNTAAYLHGGGTTGKSKTIMLSSNNINAIALHLCPFLEKKFAPGTEYDLVVLPMFHAFGLAAAVHYPLYLGYCLIPMPEFSAEKANKMLKQYKVSFLLGVPNMFKKMMEEEHFDGPHLANFKMVFCGGDFLPEKLVESFNKTVAKNNGTARLCRGYGLTEVTSVCCANNYMYSRPNSVGKAIDDITVEIWDEMKHKVPCDVDGEIVIRGDTVMQGYFNGDDTEPDDGVYIDKNGTRWIMTGDLGHLDKDGFLFFTGRKKRMIIISGYNVYPADIENTVLQLPFVNDVCAVQGYIKGKPCVKLCVVKNDEIDEEKAEKLIITHCKKNLSKFSCPRKFEFTEALPRTKMGKVDFVKLSDKYEEAE